MSSQLRITLSARDERRLICTTRRFPYEVGGFHFSNIWKTEYFSDKYELLLDTDVLRYTSSSSAALHPQASPNLSSASRSSGN